MSAPDAPVKRVELVLVLFEKPVVAQFGAEIPCALQGGAGGQLGLDLLADRDRNAVLQIQQPPSGDVTGMVWEGALDELRDEIQEGDLPGVVGADEHSAQLAEIVLRVLGGLFGDFLRISGDGLLAVFLLGELQAVLEEAG